MLRAAKRRVIETLLASEFTVLTRLLARIAAGHYSTRDYSADSLRQAFELFVLHFPVYRTYITAAGPTENDHALIAAAIAKARQDWFAADDGNFDFLQDALTLDLLAPAVRPTAVSGSAELPSKSSSSQDRQWRSLSRTPPFIVMIGCLPSTRSGENPPRRPSMSTVFTG